LSVNGKSYSQRLKVLEDPRVKVFTISLSHQLKFAQQIESARVQVAMASHSVESLLTQLQDLKGQIKGPLAVQAEALAGKLRTIGGNTSASPADWSGVPEPPTSLNNLNYLGGALADLEQAVESADAAPSADTRTGFKLQQKLLTPVLNQWRQLQLADLPQMNAALQNAGLTPLKF
ncbi:MAG: hypothetical protein ACRER0_03460, partial [Gammaproteobacteria bacterium]